MATLNKFLQERAMADANHRQGLRNLATAVTANNRRTILDNMGLAEAALETVMAAHIAYVQKSGLTMETREHQDWIDSRGDTHHAAVQAAQDAVDLLDVPPDPLRTAAMVRQELEILELRITALHTGLQAAA